MTKKEAEDALDAVRRGDLFLDFSAHFWQRVTERLPGFTRQHVYHVVRTGEVIDAPVYSEKYNNHRIKIRTCVADFGIVELVAGISWFDDAVCITIYGKN